MSVPQLRCEDDDGQEDLPQTGLDERRSDLGWQSIGDVTSRLLRRRVLNRALLDIPDSQAGDAHMHDDPSNARDC